MLQIVKARCSLLKEIFGMPALVTINNATLEQLTYKDQRVVTFEMIAEVHGISVKNVQNAFQRNKKRLIDGQDYFRLNFTEASQIPSSRVISPRGEMVFTEHGYLLLVKPLRDDVSWEVQRRMIDAYFRLQQEALVPRLHDPRMQMLMEAVIRMDALEQQLVSTKEDLISNQQATIAAQADALQAKAMALQALQDQQWVTIHQYVVQNRLEHQMPESAQRTYGTWLAGYCLERRLHVYKIGMINGWDINTYHAGTIRDTIEGWLLRQTAQQHLTLVH